LQIRADIAERYAVAAAVIALTAMALEAWLARNDANIAAAFERCKN
jgi:hypothetical protein